MKYCHTLKIELKLKQLERSLFTTHFLLQGL